jgi:hypothetical protein
MMLLHLGDDDMYLLRFPAAASQKAFSEFTHELALLLHRPARQHFDPNDRHFLPPVYTHKSIATHLTSGAARAGPKCRLRTKLRTKCRII